MKAMNSLQSKAALILLLFIVLTIFDEHVAASTFTEEQLDKLYCGRNNCYDILEITRSANKQDISKSYRQLARKWHPDRNPSSEAAERFQLIAKAYKVLTDEGIRAAYDYYLDHPTDVISLFYGIRAVYPKQTSPLLVVTIIVSFVSFIQIVQSNVQFNRFRSGVKRTIEFQKMVKQTLEEQHGSKYKKLSDDVKASYRREVEDKLLDEAVHINGVKLKQLQFKDVFIIKLCLLPFVFCKRLYKHSLWIFKFYVLRKEYGDEEKNYLTRRKLGYSEVTWENMNETDKEKLLEAKLWIKENWKLYLEAVEENQRDVLKQSARFRKYQRWKKKLG